MKEKSQKFLLLFLFFALLLPAFSAFTAFGTETAVFESLEKDSDGNAVIYVSLFGSDEKSNTMGTFGNPLKTIDAAIKLVNSLGLKSGDRATVKIITTTETDAWGDTGYVTYQNSSSHTAEITYTSAGSEKAYLSCYGIKGNTSNSLWLHGPSVFKNLKLIDQRADATRGIYLQGHDAVFENVEHYYLKTDAAGTLRTKKADIYMHTNRNGSGTFGNGGRFVLDNGSTAGKVIMGGLKDSGGGKDLKNDVTFVLNGGELAALKLSCSADGYNTVFEKNVNVVVNNASIKAITSNDKGETIAPPIIKGAFQLILNNSSCGSVSLTAKADDSSDAVGYYITSSDSECALDVTEETGVYSVTGGKVAYITDNQNEKVYYGSEKISVPHAGAWSVRFADSVEELRESIKLMFGVSEIFDDGRGTISVQIPKYRHVMKITDAGAGLESNTVNGKNIYNSENTTLFGQTVRKITRNPEVSDAEANKNPLIYKYAAIIDENGRKIPVGDVRYITIRYYFDSAESEPSLEAQPMAWTQGRFLAADGSGDWINGISANSAAYSGTAPKAITANSWNTVTVDMHKSAMFLQRYNETPELNLGQYKFSPISKLMKDSEALYIGDIIFTSYDPAEELSKPDMIFISENGSDEENGSSIKKAVKTIARAYELAANAEKSAFIIDGSVGVGKIENEYPGLTVSLASYDTENPGSVTEDIAEAPSDIIFYNVNISGIDAAGKSLVFDKSFGSAANIVCTDGKLELCGGEINTLTVGGDSSDFVSVVINGADINNFNVSSNAEIFTLGYMSGNIASVTQSKEFAVRNFQLLSGADVTVPKEIENLAVTDKRITVVPPEMKSSDGEVFGIYPTDSFGVFETYSGASQNFGYGLTTYICYAPNTDGTKIYYSNAQTGYKLVFPESGTYKLEIAGERSYTAANGKNIPGFSVNLLKLPAGAESWSDDKAGTISAVMSEESKRFVNDGYVLAVKADGQSFELGSLYHASPEGKVFLGWSFDKDGSRYPDGTQQITLNKGDKLYAVFADADMEILGVQIRLASEKATQGLRFITKTNKNFVDGLLSSKEYGSVVMPTKYLGENDLLLDAEYAYDGKNYASAKVSAEKIFSFDEVAGELCYTACIVGIIPDNYVREYSVRPYAKYTDKNGIERVYYGSAYSSGIFRVANYALRRDNSLTDDVRTYFSQISSDGIAKLQAPVSYSYGSAASSESEYEKGNVIYTVDSGVNVREIHLPKAKTAKNATTIAIITDPHINVVDPVLDKNDPEVQYTDKTRLWCRGGVTISNLESAMKFASVYDQTAVTGDIADYLSLGALEAFKKVALDPYPDGLYVLGGHDVTKNMETGFPDKTPLEERHAILQKYFTNDIFYTSKVVNDSIMCIQLDNGLSNYWDSQIPLLESDLAKAREMGYTVLIFEHEPLATGNPDDTAVPSLDRDADSAKKTYNFYGSAHIGGSGKNDTAASKAIYKLITQNGDIIGGIFSGHRHYRYYTEILATDIDGNECVIPQYVLRSNAYDKDGHVTLVIFDKE